MAAAKKKAAKPVAVKRKLPAPTMDKLDAADAKRSIADRIASGESYREIAADVGCSLGRFAHWIDETPERSAAHARAREISAIACDDEALAVVKEAADPFELAKAKELAVHYRWRSRVSDPKRYGDRQEVNVSGKIEMASAIIAARKRSGG
jgi:hypothetical protein